MEFLSKLWYHQFKEFVIIDIIISETERIMIS